MKRLILLSLIAFVLILQTGCAGSNRNIKKVTGVKTVAIVSFSLNDWGANQTVKFFGSSASGGMGASMKTQQQSIQRATNDLLLYTEKRLAKNWQMKKAATFISNKKYQTLTVEKTLDAYVPKIKGKGLGVFTQTSSALKKARLDPELAKKLCVALSVDAVFVVFTEWTDRMGRMVPITKPFTKNIVSLWGKNGQQLFARRVDKVGTVVIGGMGAKVAISIPNVIEDYKNTYKQSLDIMLK